MSNLFVARENPNALGAVSYDAKTEPLPSDVNAREQALNIQESWIVEAPAGSGKTGLLIQRYLKLLAEESVQVPGQVLAITFTKKAAAEIRERVVAQLENAAIQKPIPTTDFERDTRALAETVLEKDRRLGWGLLENPKLMSLKTIDSLCGQIAGSTPVLSGGRLSPVEDSLPLHQAAARRTIMQLGGEDVALNDALRLILLHRDGNLAECERLLSEMLAVREQWGDLIPLSAIELDEQYLEEVVRPKLERTLEQIVCTGLSRLAMNAPMDFMEKLSTLASSFAERGLDKHGVSPTAICAGKGIPKTDATQLEHWRALIHMLVLPMKWTWRKKFDKALCFEASELEKKQWKQILEQVSHRKDLLDAMRQVDKLPPAKYPDEQWGVAKALFRLLRRALGELQLVFAESGECDFAEQVLLARSVMQLEGSVGLAETQGMELRHLLVDEMQDTSTIQFELLQLLTQSWDGRSQTVFLVGDPKQSIYLFRQARVERFIRTIKEERLGDLPLKSLWLSANFRSQQELVSDFNADFSLLFPNLGNGAMPSDEVLYQDAAAVKRASYFGAGRQWHTRVIEGRRASSEAKRNRQIWQKDEARIIRDIVQKWWNRPLPAGRNEPWKIAVLVQARRHLEDVIAEFKKDDGNEAIPFCAINIDELDERQEVMDLFALTRALLHPADRTAWLGVLRAPWCGLSLSDLHIVAGGDDPLLAEQCISELIQFRKHLLSEEGHRRVELVAAVMKEAEKRRGRLRIADWTKRTWRSLGGDASLTDAEFANARRYLQLLDEVEANKGYVDISQLKRKMKKLYAQSVPIEGAVDLMTIHGAKGLEWDVVMVPGLARRTGNSHSGLLEWNEIEESDKRAAHGMLAPIGVKGEPTKKLNAWMNGLRSARESAERKRLFYVACTRAREELHLFAAPGRLANGGISLEPTSLLKAAWPAAEGQFIQTASSMQSAKTIPFAPLTVTEESEQGLNIAASGEDVLRATKKPATLQRLPLSFNAERFATLRRLAVQPPHNSIDWGSFERPEGSFAARAFGNAVHGFLELASRRLGEGISHEALLQEIKGWTPRIEMALRGDGLSPAVVKRETQRVLTAVQTTLEDSEGRWILGVKNQARSEFSFTTWEDRIRTFRLDRMFVAGDRPLTVGSDCLWIVDYKTTSHGRSIGIEAFLAGERLKYGPQIETYAQALAIPAEIRYLLLGLYYPMMPKLLWWKLGKN